MHHSILAENEQKRLHQPWWMLVCFAMFSFWQMGFIYFVGPSLTINGKTPLPINMDNATSLIAVCYVLSILWMLFLPQTVVWTQRIATAGALLTAIGLFLPLPDDALRLLVYIQIFCCCLMIGFETFVLVNYFSEHSNVRHLTLAYGVSLLMIAVLQNQFFPISFPAFRVITVAALLMLLLFFLRMPTGKKALPVYVTKKDGIPAPKRLLAGTYILVFVCALMGVSGPALAAETKHGVFLTYLVDAIVSLILFILYAKRNIHPFRVIPVCIGLGSLGFLLMFASTQVSWLANIGCALIGIGMVTCQMLPLYGSVVMKSWPSRSISPVIIGLALAAVLVESSLVEAFRAAPNMLCLVYAVIMMVLVILYMQIEPFFLFTLRSRITVEKVEKEQTDDAAESREAEKNDPLDILSGKEREVAELICLGHTNADIAQLLYISVHTVKTHTKKIYPKMGIHSRLELAALVSKHRQKP